jgi:23S rRNA (guanine745-N1)-methyltransferase
VYDLGVAEPLLDGIAELTGAGPNDAVLDVGCGEGWFVANLAERTRCLPHGLDISIPAVEAAARRYPDSEWVVANADRFIPYAGQSFDLVLSITSRMNPEEFRRVLRDRGRLLVALPSPDDLIELRGHGRDDRVSRTMAEFEPKFGLYNSRRVTTHALLTAEQASGLLRSVYRPLGPAPADSINVTFSFDLLLFHPL